MPVLRIFVLVLIGLAAACSDTAKEVSQRDANFIQPLTPQDQTKLFESRVALSWRDTAETSPFGYRVQVANDAQFESVVVDEQTTELGIEFTVDDTLPVHELHWRVSKINEDNTLAQWSKVYRVTVVLNSVALSSPIGAKPINQQTPVFNWQPNEFAQRYLFRLYKDSNLSQLFFSTEVEANEITLPADKILPESASQAYYWHVIPIIDGVHGVASDTEVFYLDTIPPAAITLDKDSGLYNIASRFNSVGISGTETNATVIYTMSTDGSDPVDPTLDNATHFEPDQRIDGIIQNGQTLLKVAQVDEAGNVGPVTAVEYFLDTTPPRDLSADKTSGMYNSTTTFNQLAINNIEESGTAHYEMTTDGTTPDIPTAESPALSRASNLIDGINQNGTTRINVLPVDSAGNTGPMLALNFNIDTIAPAFSIVVNNDAPDTHSESVNIQVQTMDDGDFAEYQVLNPDSTDNGVWHGYQSTFYNNSDALTNTHVATIDMQVVIKDRHGNVSTPVAGSVELKRTLVTEDITAPTTWTAANGPYLIRADVSIAANATLTIESTDIMYEGDYTITVGGNIDRVGGDYALITSLEPTTKPSLSFVNTDLSATDLSYVRVQAFPTFEIRIDAASTNALQLNFCEFLDSSVYVNTPATVSVMLQSCSINNSLVSAQYLAISDGQNSVAAIDAQNLTMVGTPSIDTLIVCRVCSVSSSHMRGGPTHPEAFVVSEQLALDDTIIEGYDVGVILSPDISAASIYRVDFNSIGFAYIINESPVSVDAVDVLFGGDVSIQSGVIGPVNVIAPR